MPEKSHNKKKLTKWQMGFTMLSALLILGAIWQAGMVQSEKGRCTAIGEFADLGTYQAHYYSKGEGELAIVFITGSGTPCAYTDFYELQNRMSSVGQTITFDHEGSGWSTEANANRTMKNLISELSILIDTVAPNKPIILICHSLGSLEAIGYTQQNPERVKGIIFLDSGSPEFYSTDSELAAIMINRCVAFPRAFGITRLLGDIGVLLPIYGENIRNTKLPEDIRNIDKAMFYRLAGNSSSLSTIQMINENAESVIAGASLGKAPILVLSSDNSNKWEAVQKQLSAWSENSKQVTLNGAEHYIHWSSSKVLSEIEMFIKYTLDN